MIAVFKEDSLCCSSERSLQINHLIPRRNQVILKKEKEKKSKVICID